MRVLVGELVRETLDVDGRAFRSVRALLFQPGVLTREYLAGRRRFYTSPLRLYLVISITFFVLLAWVASQGILLDISQDQGQGAAEQAQFMSETLPKLMFVLLPIFALFLKGLYPRRLYFDHIIFSLHLHSAAYVALAVMLPLEEVSNTHWLPLIVQLIATGYLLGYLVVSVHRVYQSSWVAASAKSMVILFGYLSTVFGVTHLASVLNA